jgi:hypothetical protein
VLRDFRNSIAAVPEVATFYRWGPHSIPSVLLARPTRGSPQRLLQVHAVLLFTTCQSQPWQLLCGYAFYCHKAWMLTRQQLFPTG